MLHKIIDWIKKLFSPRKRGSYFMPITEERCRTKISELKDGTRVFYIDVTGIRDDKVDEYIERVRKTLSPEGER